MSVEEFIEMLRRPLGEMPRELEMMPLPGPFDVKIRPPGSKSLTNRALLLAALAEGESVITGALIDADDARVMIDALRQLGAGIEVVDPARWNPDRKGGGAPSGAERASPVAGAPGSMAQVELHVKGTGGRLRGNCTLNLKNAGTATRFLTAAACLADGPVEIDGNERMRQRPIGELVAMLRQLGVRVEELGVPGCVPVKVWPIPSSTPQHVLKIGQTASSQFVSAILMIGQLLPRGLLVEFEGRPTSESYIEMTLALMDEWPGGSGDASVEGELPFAHLHRGRYFGNTYSVEPDASGATYWWGAEAIVAGSRCAVPIDPSTSVQADSRFGDALRHRGGHVDLTLMPDAAMTLAVVACFASPGGTTTITGLRTLRVKETDRLEAIRTELTKVGARVEVFQTPTMSESASESSGPPDEGLRITPPPGGIDCSPGVPRVVFETYDDHRMAMSLALIGLRRPNVVIRDPQCVAKTYPTFWRHLSLLYQSAIEGARRLSSEGD